ncbi:uncharacterized protein Dwil_GK13801 [Drosophila willistoni]|uniref:EF-hand domain-containing protein n=1 Tax=Drosophila willistoni TaxID=7260 RepID=B4NIT4_DROWI|nr:uncharacterized protein Dwil_GK13801 [Drosophila willistoni]
MTFVNKLSKSFRWLRCSTLCAIQTKLAPNVEPHNSRKQKHSPEELEQHQHQQPKLKSLLTTNDLDSEKANEKVAKHLHLQLPEKMQPKAPGLALGLAKNASKSPNQPETVILAASNVNEKQILAKAFKRADRNRDGRLSIQEMAQYINRRIVDHIEEAIMNNAREFRRVDIGPADGLITWDEYHRFFLHDHGMSDTDIDEHDEIRHTALNRKAREDMMRDKARWSEAARTDLFTLTIDEFLSFRHPESSVSNLLELVDDLLRQFDQDGDEQLTMEEFSELNVDDDDDLLRKSLISKTLVERREEFKRIIDKNHDGKADRGELLNYVNPKTPRYALQEAVTLFSLCDENKDEMLTLKEMTDNAEIFLQSKMIDTANSFHTEF